MPAKWSEVHHVQHWAHGGPTNPSNLLLICKSHHKAAHSGRWTVVLDEPGVITVRQRLTSREPLYEIRPQAPPGAA